MQEPTGRYYAAQSRIKMISSWTRYFLVYTLKLTSKVQSKQGTRELLTPSSSCVSGLREQCPASL